MPNLTPTADTGQRVNFAKRESGAVLSRLGGRAAPQGKKDATSLPGPCLLEQFQGMTIRLAGLASGRECGKLRGKSSVGGPR